MRLTKNEIDTIKETFYEVFKEGEVYLFGSRVDNNKKGGDIDLFIKLPYKIDFNKLLDKKNLFRFKLEQKIGEQKIDILVDNNKSSSIKKEAILNGVLL